ncbi:PREDICTED: E3 ubiquitin-protein ligase RNF213-like [Nanorana parkeri]|uniref:E3 ubiquitin-protein ligase RNF213-like n=2 Tax=Nanorana parkeri TaxID=125878 RepID=UPI0008544526|nr:PREDICTED: E3 ubiquitin-protein ligase RNF213-like [Nanorana parkeri]
MSSSKDSSDANTTIYHWIQQTIFQAFALKQQHQTDNTSESNSQLSDLEKVLEEALWLTKKWLEDVYGHKFNLNVYEKPSLHSELWEEAINQISLYCKELNAFKDLHPSIKKCFEDCAIEAVHLACQSETNILSKLSSYNLENFGRLVSSVIENSWPKDNQGNYVKESDAILQHLLMWTDATYIFKLYGTDSRIISQFGVDIQELVALSESVFLEAVRNVMDGKVLYKHIESILKHKEQFVAICKLKTEKNEKPLLNEINQVLTWWKAGIDKLRIEREWVNSLLKMIDSVDKYIKVNVSEIHAKHLQELGSQKLMDILPVKTPNSPDEFIGHALSYYNLSAPSMTMAEHLNTFRTSHVFTTCWERQANAVAESSHSESSNESEDDTEYTVEEIVDELFNPCLENCKKIYNDLKSGQVTFEVVDKFLADFKDNYKNLEKELEILCGLGVRDNKTWISKRVSQIEEYHELDVAFRSAEVIFEVKSSFNLDGDFQTLETLLQFADEFENYKQKSLSCISTEVMKTKKLLSKVNENHIACLKEVLKRRDFIVWVKEALTDVNELKVFVDLASISAGENDMDVDRVACFHDAVLGYSPLFYDLKREFGFDSFMLCLEKLWKALQSDPKLPEKLKDSARHIEWLKTVKESHGSVELSSLSLTTSINKKGIYIIRAPKDKKKITLESVLNLVLPENKENSRLYTLEELKELLNKLMLMSSKGEQGNMEVDKFSEIFSNVQRLAGSFIDLYLAGNMLFRTWGAVIQCADNATVSVRMNFDVEGIEELQAEEALTDLLPSICKTMERLLEEWLAFVNKKRSELYYLNYYTAEQLVYLCQQYQMREISEEALVMLSFIKPDCEKIDTINSFYFSKTGSCYPTAVNQPDMMDFAMELEVCRDVSKKLELVWKFSMDNMNSFFPGCLDLDALGTSLAALAEQNKKTVDRDLHPSLQPGRPNLILCPPSEMLSCAIAVYMHTSGEALPSYDEVLLCTPHTTFEEVALFLRRCLTLGYSGKKIYSLINADLLSYDVGYKSELLFQQLQAKCIEKYNLVIICNSDREGCYIPSVFSQFKIHVIPQKQPVEIQRYLCTHFKIGSEVVSAASMFKNGMSAGIVSSKRAGVGKSLYVKRLYQKLGSKFSSKKPLLKIIRLIKPEVDENKVLETLLPFLNGKSKSCPIIFHIDITSSVKSGISEFLFKLLVLQYLMDSEGRIWKRLPSHLYIIEILECSDILFRKQFKSVPRIVQNGLIDFFPKIHCCSPKEVLTKTTQTDVIDCGDPGMDIEEFRSECFQRPYQYLIRFDQEQNLDAFVYIEGHTEGDPAKCLQIFLLYCGIVDPSWSELRNFAWFLNLQLRDCEASVFCNHEFVGDTLQGFKNFVVNFMILMAKDFATPSLHIADQSPGRYEINLDDGVQEQDLVPFLMRKRWESEPHPYIFFNEDHASMTFIGFHLEPNNAGGVDAINPRNNRIIRQNVMSLQLYAGLRLQRVPFNTDFDQLPRHEKISSLCMVLGIQWPMDPDETYELTMDNMLKILAIKMRFRCGIPVVIMGETGCGKTRLIKFLCHLCKGFVETENMKLVKVHGGTTAETIYQKILEAQEIAQINKQEGCETVLFFDEANTTEAISSIKEALCDHTVEGVPLQEDCGLHIIAACNPYRKHTDDMIKRLESAGLGYKVRADEAKERLGSIPLRQLVYRVHALPPSMIPLVWDFGQLNNETENKYIQQIVLRLAKEIRLSTSDIQLLTDVLSASQSYMRDKNDECSFVSLRDVERCIEVFKWFFSRHDKLKHHPSLALRRKSTDSVVDKAAWSLVLAVGVCYHASLETKDSFRRAICKFFPLPYRDPTIILQEITSIQELFLAGVQLRDTIARNLALKENLFMMVICIELKIPLFLVGKPGSSKSLAKTIVADAMQGQTAHTELYKDLKQIHLVSFQCSPHSTPEGIIGTFRHCARFQEGKNLNEYVSVVVLDEIGLAEDSPKMPLKTLHPLLEDGCIDDDTSPHKKVGFIGISNWALDPAKMNRGIFVSRGDPNKKELIESANGICSSDKLILHKVSQYFSNFSEGYLKVCKTLKEQEKEFFGLRDFYSLIKMVFAFTKQSQTNLTLDEIARAVLRNFSGKDEVNALEIFLGDESRNIEYSNTIDLVMENIRSDSDDCRYLLILTKNYAGLQILQQAFLKENQQPEIIFGSSFPKDQEYTQICRNINRVKICMETGQMVILLNLQNLYESLYDALNQYYVYLAGQKYVDLGLGTHRVKCRVHPKFRLVVIEEKEVVYKDFPIPLINRLEKHYLDINTFLKKEHKVIVCKLEAWVEDFTKGKQAYTIGNTQTYRPSDVFIGYHSDTCASVVLQVTENMKQSHTDTQMIKDVKNKAEQVLLNCATPDSVIRLGRKELIEEYFKKQKHGSLLDFLYYHVTTGYDNHTIFTEITTFSRLLTSVDRKVLETELQSQVSSIEILSLQQFDTEFSFLKKIRSFLECSSGNLILIIQTDFEEGSQGANLVASAKYAAVNEIQKVNLKEASVFVYFITKLPRMQGGTSYVGFRGGLWQSIHIDDLRKSKDMVDDVTALQDLTISRLFHAEEKKEPGKNDTKHKTNMETEMEVEMIHGNEDSEIHGRGDEVDKNEKMDINMEGKMEPENETSEAQEMETDDPLPRPEDMLDTTILIRSCIQNAIGLLRDEENIESRSTRRIEILISLMSTEDQIKSSFLKMLKYRLFKLLKTQEENVYNPEQWVIREAANQDALQEAGTFRQTLWKRVQTAVTPLLSQILSVVDRNANLDLLVAKHVEDYVKCLWMHIFQDENLLPISDSHSSQNETILVKNYMNIAVFGENCLPFSWRIKDYLEDIWTQAQHIDTTEGPAMKFLEIFCKTPLGKYVSSKEENTQHNLFLIYKRDFILMNMSISSAEELKIMEFALSACIEELRSSTKSKEPLQLPWVHIGYSKFQHRLQNLNRILVVNFSVLDSLLQKITDPKPMLVLDIYAAIACLESLKHTMQRSDPQEWMRQDNRPPDDEVIHHLISFLFDKPDSVSHTRSLSPFEDAVDKTPVIRSVILKLLLKYSFDNIMKHAQDYLDRVKGSNLLKLADTKEVYLLFINCLEDSLYEKKQKVQNEDEKLEYFELEASFLQNYLRSSKWQRNEETSVQLLQDVARVRLALDVAAEMMSVKLRGSKNEQYLRCVEDLCSQSGNDWYRVYLIRKLANLEGIDMVQRHFKDPAFRWLFPQEMLQKKDTETNHIDHFLVCRESYKVLREGISRAMMEGKEERIATAMEECKNLDQKLAVHLLLAVFREITMPYAVCNNGQQNTALEQESVMDFIKNANIFKDRFLKQFLETLLTNSRPVLRALPGMRGSYVTIFGLAVHLASILLSGNNHLLAPLKNLSFLSARMQNSFLPTMPEDLLSKAKNVMRKLHWYRCPNGHYCAVGECGRPMQTGRCPDCGAIIGGQNHAAHQGFERIQQDVDRTQPGHVLGDPDRQGPAVAPDRDIAAPAFILLRMITHLAMLLGSEEDTQSLMRIVKPPIQNVTNFIFCHIERDLEYLRNSLGKSTDDTTTVVHLILDKMLSPQRSGQWPVNFDETWSTKEMRNNWEKHFVSMVITPVLGSLNRDLMTVNNYIRQDERISSNPVVKVVYGDPLISGEKMDLPQDSNVYCSKIWNCRNRISIEYILHTVQQQDGKDTLPLLWKFLEKETELQMVKFLPDMLKLQKDLVKKFQNYKDINFKTIGDFLQSIKSDGAQCIFKQRIQKFIRAWNHLRLFLQTNGEIKLPEGMCDEILTMDSEFEFLLPRRQGLGLGATALTSYLIALHNSFIYALAKYTNIEQNYSIKASEVMDLHVISYELEKDLVPIILSNCQYSLESGKETLQEFDFPKIQNQLTTRLLQGKPLITMVGLPTLTLSHDRNYEHLFTDLKKRLPQDSLSNSAIDVISKDLNAFSDVCEALNIVDISVGFLATSGGDAELSLTGYVEDVLQMKEQSSTHVLEALKRCYLKNTIALWQLLTALKSQHLLHLKRDPFASVDTVYKHELDKERQHALNVFLEQNGTNRFLLELHEMIMLKLGKPRSADDFPPSWILRDVLVPLLDDKGVSFMELENDFPEQIALAHCIEAWKVAANKKWNRI